MESLFSDLSMVLIEQNQTSAALLAAARDHNTALRKNDIKAILETAFQQEELSRDLTGQDQKRVEILEELAGEHGLEKPPRLSALLPYASEAAAAELKGLSHSFKATLTQLSEINDLNRILARRGRAITEQILRAIRANGGTYLKSGKMEDQGKPLSFMDKTI